MSLEIVDCQAADLPALRGFFARVYGPDYILARDAEFLRWQFQDRNAHDSYRLKLARFGGQLVGCLGSIPMEVSFAGRVVAGAWLANWVVDPGCRRLGVGPLLMREMTESYEVILNLGPSPDARSVLSRMGWSDLGELDRFVCVLDADLAGSLAETGAAGRGFPAPARARPEVPGWTVTRVAGFGEEATVLWDRLWGGRPRCAAARRSAEFLNWRYARHPRFRYSLFEQRIGGELTGLAVSRLEQVRDRPVGVARIVEIVASPETQAHLLGEVIDDAQRQGAALIDFFCHPNQVWEGLCGLGFLPGTHPAVAAIPLLFQPLDRRRSAIVFMVYGRDGGSGNPIEEWYVTKADADQDRPN